MTSIRSAAACWVVVAAIPACHGDHRAPPVAETATEAASPGSANSCEALKGLVIPHVTIEEAQLRASPSPSPSPGAGLPEHCRIFATSRPTQDSLIRVEIAVPTGDRWNGRYLQVGNGGFGGLIPEGDIMSAVANGFAAAGTDDGHASKRGTDAAWALGHHEKLVDYGYRAVKETSDVAREVLRAYTGRGPAHAYFSGCSDGGREALMEAQRFPDDFDGIVAGAPANDATHLLFAMAWDTLAMRRIPEGYLTHADLTLVQVAARAACAAPDGVIDDPLGCHFDLRKLRCAGSQTDHCLSDAKIAAITKVYEGPTNPRTHERIFPGFEPGAEAEEGSWKDWISGEGSAHPPVQSRFAESFARDMLFEDPQFDLARLNFDADVKRAEDRLAPILDASDPDLGVFAKRGGKIIQYHGWSDATISPRDSIAYYERVRGKLGDTRGFYRLFMAPGMLHCGGGQAPNDLPTLEAITAWVEQGRAPDVLMATKYIGDDPTKPVLMRRPLCPYPERALWDGHGDRHEPTSFHCSGAPAK